MHNCAGNNLSHMSCVTISTRATVKVVEHIVKITVSGVNVYVVYVALCAVKENTFSAVNSFFKNSSSKAWPVARNFVSANRIGVVTKVS